MVDTTDSERPLYYASQDSAPPRLAVPVSPSRAPQVLAVGAVISLALLLLLHRVPSIRAAFPEGDLYVSRYEGPYVLPLRVFMISFFISLATAISAPLFVRVRFTFWLVFPFLLYCAVLDLCNAVLALAVGTGLPLQIESIVTGIVGFFLFSTTFVRFGDMPERNDGPMRPRFKLGSFFTVSAVIVLAAWLSVYLSGIDLPLIGALRDLALVGGVSVGFFLFVPMVFFLLNLLAAVRDVIRSKRPYTPDMTILLPAFNEAHGIARTIAAVDLAAGNYGGSVTLIVIDNRSIDDTEGECRKAFALCTSLKTHLISESRRGKANALNSGLAMVHTQFFARLDADTTLKADSLTRGLRYFTDPYTSCVGGLPLPPTGGMFDGARLVEVLIRSGYEQVGLSAANAIVGIPGMFAVYRTSVAREVGGFAVGLNGEDTDMALRMGEAGYRLVIDPHLEITSEVPRTFDHLREQRHRWYRSLYHVFSRNQQIFESTALSARGIIVMPFLLTNTGRRVMGWPLLLFAINFLLLDPDPRSTVHVTSVLAILLGAPFIKAILAITVNLRPRAFLQLPAYIVFRMLRYYLTLEAVLSVTFTQYQQRITGTVQIPSAEPEPAWSASAAAEAQVIDFRQSQRSRAR